MENELGVKYCNVLLPELVQAQRQFPDEFNSNYLWTGVTDRIFPRVLDACGSCSPLQLAEGEYPCHFTRRLDFAYVPTGSSYLEVAVEHECMDSLWVADEWVKLHRIQARLRILVSYHRYTPSNPVSNRLAEAVKAWSLIVDKQPGEFLLILGPTSHKPVTKPWVAYSFDGGKFEFIDELNANYK